jgi:hypothetical protein
VAKFSREERAKRDRIVNVRCSEEEKDLLAGLAPLLGVRGQSDVLRLALDYFLARNREARAALARLEKK